MSETNILSMIPQQQISLRQCKTGTFFMKSRSRHIYMKISDSSEGFLRYIDLLTGYCATDVTAKQQCIPVHPSITYIPSNANKKRHNAVGSVVSMSDTDEKYIKAKTVKDIFDIKNKIIAKHNIEYYSLDTGNRYEGQIKNENIKEICRMDIAVTSAAYI